LITLFEYKHIVTKIYCGSMNTIGDISQSMSRHFSYCLSIQCPNIQQLC